MAIKLATFFLIQDLGCPFSIKKNNIESFGNNSRKNLESTDYRYGLFENCSSSIPSLFNFLYVCHTETKETRPYTLTALILSITHKQGAKKLLLFNNPTFPIGLFPNQILI